MASFNVSSDDTSIVRVKREDLIQALQANLEKHQMEFALAIEQFRKDVIEEMKKNLRQAQKDGELVLHLKEHNRPPESNVDAYNAAIERYTMSVDETVLLNENQFDRYVRNKWEWSHRVTNSVYAAKAAPR